MAEYDERVKEWEGQLQLAIYFAKAFMEELGKERALEIIKKAWVNFGTANMNKRLAGVPQDDRLKALGEWFENAVAERPELKLVEATPKRVCIEISRCPVYEVCNNQGVPEICQMYCDSDYIVALTIQPKVKLVRDKVLAYGDDYCNHCFVLED